MQRYCYILITTLFFCTSIGTGVSQEYRSFDGSRNNLSSPTMGVAGTHYSRIGLGVSYADGVGEISSEDMNPRIISNILFDNEEEIFSERELSDFVWAFGQFICHDIDHVTSSAEEFGFENPADDDFFAPNSQQTYLRKAYAQGTGTGKNNPRQYVNYASSYLDASVIYGSDEERASWLRTFEGGKLKTSDSDFLPWNTNSGFYNDNSSSLDVPSMKMMPGRTSQKLFVAGDERANKNPLLLSLHTIFAREHNRLCVDLADKHPSWDDEKLYQMARKYIGAMLQKITYDDWLPAMGLSVPEYGGYDASVDVSLSNAFSSAAIVFESTLIGNQILRLDNNGQAITDGNLEVGEYFYYNPKDALIFLGVDPYLKGAAVNMQQAFDLKAATNVRNFDYEQNIATAFDRVAERIVEARDRGVLSYIQVRQAVGLSPYTNFMELTGNDVELSAQLEAAYGDIDNLDLWVGLLAEKRINDSQMGELMSYFLEKQFRDIRDGDRFYYENETSVFTQSDIDFIKNTTLKDLILRNSGVSLVQDDVFYATPHENLNSGPEITQIHLEADVYPNPSFSRTVNLKLYSDYATKADVVVRNVLGYEICSVSKDLKSGYNFFQLDLSHFGLLRGTYIVKIDSDQYIQCLQLILE